jgi:hypothetical protein
MTVIATIPGAAYRLARDGSPGELAAEALARAHVTKRGRGTQALLLMSREQANELADYFWSVAGVVGEMTGAERDGGNEHQAAQQAILRIEAALREAPSASVR